MTNEIKEIKIGMYTTDEILEFMTNGEGRGFMGRSMYDAIIDYITNLQNEIFDLKDTIQNKNDCIGAYECIIEDRDKRIDKAIELLKEAGSYDEKSQTFCDDVWEELSELLNILRGDE